MATDKSERHTEEDETPALLLAEFDTAGKVLHAAEKLRDAGYTKFDSHSPFPIHGMDAAAPRPSWCRIRASEIEGLARPSRSQNRRPREIARGPMPTDQAVLASFGSPFLRWPRPANTAPVIAATPPPTNKGKATGKPL